MCSQQAQQSIVDRGWFISFSQLFVEFNASQVLGIGRISKPPRRSVVYGGSALFKVVGPWGKVQPMRLSIFRKPTVCCAQFCIGDESSLAIKTKDPWRPKDVGLCKDHSYLIDYLLCYFHLLHQQTNTCRNDLELWMMCFSCISITFPSYIWEIRQFQNHCHFSNLLQTYYLISSSIYFWKKSNRNWTAVGNMATERWGALQSWEAKCLWCIYGTSTWWRRSCTSFTRYDPLRWSAEKMHRIGVSMSL